MIRNNSHKNVASLLHWFTSICARFIFPINSLNISTDVSGFVIINQASDNYGSCNKTISSTGEVRYTKYTLKQPQEWM